MLTGFVCAEALLNLKPNPHDLSLRLFIEPRFVASDGCSDLKPGLCVQLQFVLSNALIELLLAVGYIHEVADLH